MTDAHGERIARMETELQYIKRDMDELKEDVADIKAKQDQMILMLTEAKGGWKFARWLWIPVSGAGVLGISYWSSIRAFLAKIGG
jgi:hypothetical protein